MKFSALIDGVIVSAIFKQSKTACPDYDGHLVVKVGGLDEFDVQDIEETLASDNLVTFGENQNEFVINYVKIEMCEEIFKNVCNTIEFQYCAM